MIFRQLLDPETSTWTYLIGDPITREAVLVDPVRELVERDVTLVRELGLRLTHVLETHVHADHVTSGGLVARRVGAKTVLSRASGADADVHVEHGDAIRFGGLALEVRATPGHTAGCVTYVAADLSFALTGDAVLVRGCGRTDFQGGDARTLYRAVQDQIFSLPDDTLLYPAHDYRGRTVTTVREEKRWNPRLSKSEDEFVAIMGALGLPRPARMDVAVPANLGRGLLSEEERRAATPTGPWAPIARSATGAPRVTCEWLGQHHGEVHLVDVRQPEELVALAPLPSCELVPLDVLEAEAGAWAREAPLVLVCRSGGRSDRAAQILEAQGFERVASLAGGLVRWHALGLPVIQRGDTTQG
ncbi:MAG: MBL fold metallo-hydrolase [Deltaproteobacteria bacterium]|nr:MBL fold metallo-hydrolase [Deltaproteobacteria bacterium]